MIIESDEIAEIEIQNPNNYPTIGEVFEVQQQTGIITLKDGRQYSGLIDDFMTSIQNDCVRYDIAMSGSGGMPILAHFIQPNYSGRTPEDIKNSNYSFTKKKIEDWSKII